MPGDNRATAQKLAQQYLAAGSPLGWFDVLYAGGDSDFIPWADLEPNPNVVNWLESHSAVGSGRRALKIGCGLGDDSEELARRGFSTTAFDISPAAIAWCQRRFPASDVRYREADLMQAPAQWTKRFDLVVESYTLQVLPVALRAPAAARIAEFVAPGGTLLVITRAREASEPEGEMPWPLTRAEMGAFCQAGLIEIDFEDFVDQEDPAVRRFRAVYARPTDDAHRPTSASTATNRGREG